MAVWSIDGSKRMPEYAQDYTKDLTDEDRQKIILDHKKIQQKEEVISRAHAHAHAQQEALERTG